MSDPSAELIPSPGAPRWTWVWKATSFPALGAVLLVGACFVRLRDFIVDPDVWWHIQVGSTILRTHRWPVSDPYSFTAHGTPWIAYEWLGDVLLAAVERASGLRGLMTLDLMLAAAILLALYGLATLRSGNSKAAVVACAAVLPLVYLSCSLRPQMLAYLFLILTLLILERFRQGRRGTLWLLPPLFVVWVNTHGLFVLGFVALGVYWAGGLVEIHWGDIRSRLWTLEERLRLELVALLSLAVLPLTPYGTQLAVYPFDLASSQPLMVANLEEWQPMVFDKLYGKIFLVLILAFLAAQLARRMTWRLEEVTLFLVGILAACLHARFLLVFVPFAVPLLAAVLAGWIPPYDAARDKHGLNALLMALVVGGIVWFFPTRAKLEEVVAGKWPVQALAYLAQHPAAGPLYNNYFYGGYLIFQSRGRHPVFIDGRADIYERSGVLADYLSISQVTPAAPFLLDAYNIQSCLIDRREPLATLLAGSGKWQVAYQDPLSAVYVRKPDL